MILIGERKSTTSDIDPGSDYWPQLLLDPQISIYIHSAKWIGVHADGVLYDVLRVPNLRPYMATPVESRKYTKATDKEPSRLYAKQRESDESAEDYGARCLAAITKEPARYYQQQIVVRLEKEKLEAQYDAWQTATAIRDARRLKVWPRNPDSCRQYGRRCEFFNVCTGRASLDDPIFYERRAKMHSELDSPREDILTQSSMRCYRACPRRYQYRYELRYQKTGPKDEPLRRGSSLHRALEVWSKTGNASQAIGALDHAHAYSFEKEKAMIVGYIAYWGEQPGIKYVEKEFEAEFVNPDTGATSRTFVLGGRLDYVVETEAAYANNLAGPITDTEEALEQ